MKGIILESLLVHEPVESDEAMLLLRGVISRYFVPKVMFLCRALVLDLTRRLFL